MSCINALEVSASRLSSNEQKKTSKDNHEKPFSLLRSHEHHAASANFSPDGTIFVSGVLDGTIRFWDMSTKKMIKQIRAYQGVAEGLDFSPDGSILASCSADHTIRLWDASSYSLIRTMGNDSFIVCDVSFSPNREILVSGSGDAIRFEDIRSFSEIAALDNLFFADIKSIIFSPGGEMVAAAHSSGEVWLIDPYTATIT